jgi:hypothetical protein
MIRSSFVEVRSHQGDLALRGVQKEPFGCEHVEGLVEMVQFVCRTAGLKAMNVSPVRG